MLSVREFAKQKSISVPRVHELIASGAIDYERIGNWIAPPESELRWKPTRARPLSPRMANALLTIVSGNAFTPLSSTE